MPLAPYANDKLAAGIANDGGTATIQNQLDSSLIGLHVEYFQFADGTTTQTGTLENDTLTPTAVNQAFYGFDGNDVFQMGAFSGDILRFLCIAA